jgi:hypothetical protein
MEGSDKVKADYENMADDELLQVMMDKLPFAVDKGADSLSRETIIAYLNALESLTDQP